MCQPERSKRSGSTTPKAEQMSSANSLTCCGGAVAVAAPISSKSAAVTSADAEMSPYLDLVAVSRRSPRGSVCLNSALSFWDLTDEVPAEVHLAVPRGSHRPRISYPPVRVHVFATDTFNLGREQVRLEFGEEIAVYSPERSVVDAMRLRGQVGTDVAYGALRRYLRRPGSSPGESLLLAKRLRAGRPIADALQVLMG